MIQTEFIANAGQAQKDTIGYSDYSRISNLQKFGTQGHAELLFNVSRTCKAGNDDIY